MRKYWKTLVISLVIITIMTTFYIYPNVSTAHLSYKIETIQGNHKELDDIAFNLRYEGGDLPIQISKTGVKQLKRKSIFGLNRHSYYTVLNNYLKQYRSFMRGKALNPVLYHEDPQHVTYADVVTENGMLTVTSKPVALTIDSLNKVTNARSTFTIDAPQKMFNYSDMNVYDVNRNGENIQLYVYAYHNNSGGELHLYTIDEQKKTVVQDTLIAKSVQEEDFTSHISPMTGQARTIQGDSHYVYSAERVSNQGDGQTISRKIHFYNVRTKEDKVLTVPSKLQTNDIQLNDTSITFAMLSMTGLEVVRYDFINEQWNKPLNLNNINSSNIRSYIILNNKIYVSMRTDEGSSIVIFNLQTGDLLYEGKITGDNKKSLDSYIEIVSM